MTLNDAQSSIAERYLKEVYLGVRAIKAAKRSPNLNLGKSEYTFDDLRYVEFTKKVSVLLLPPTSRSIKNGHIPRWFFIYKRLSTLLNYWDSDNYDPTMYGWHMEDKQLYPKKELNLLPDNFIGQCGCKTGCELPRSKNCSCFKNELSKCSVFCKCIGCKNR